MPLWVRVRLRPRVRVRLARGDKLGMLLMPFVNHNVRECGQGLAAAAVARHVTAVNCKVLLSMDSARFTIQ